jgi:hypothetical protein
MGRPLPRKVFGPTDATLPLSGDRWSADGKDPQERNLTTEAANWNKGYNIPVYKARIAGQPMDSMDTGSGPYILSQKGSRKFKVRTDNGDGVCRLVNDDGSSGLSEGEMVLQGFIAGNDNQSVFIQRITKRRCYDFNGNAYSWYVDNDSTANVIILTAIQQG